MKFSPETGDIVFLRQEDGIISARIYFIRNIADIEKGGMIPVYYKALVLNSSCKIAKVNESVRFTSNLIIDLLKRSPHAVR